MPAADAIAQLYDAHAEAVFGFALSLARHEADARDVLQGVFVKVAERPAMLRGVENERALLLRLTHRTFVDAVRRRVARDRAHAKLTDEAAAFFQPTDEDAFDERSAELTAALDRLAEAQRTVVHLRIWERLTFEQIAALLDEPKGTIVSRWRAALDALASHLDATSRPTDPTRP